MRIAQLGVSMVAKLSSAERSDFGHLALVVLLSGATAAGLSSRALAGAESSPIANVNTSPPVPSTATGGQPSGAHFETSWDVRDFGAKCDNVTDDEPAFARAFIAVRAFYATGGRRAILHVAAGTCLLNSGTLPSFYIPSGTGGAGLAVIGDGPHQTTLRLGTGYSGDVLALSEAWNRATYVNPFSPMSDFSGITLQGFSIVGDNTATNPQNAIMFYDRNDFVLIRDVDVRFLNGRCLYVGATLNANQAYMRESNIDNVHCWHTGPTAAATFQISSTTTSKSDASNEINIHALNILGAAGSCFEISNPLNHSASRQIKVFGLRVENCGSDQIVIQDAHDIGTVANVDFYGMESIGAPSRSMSFKINAGNKPYNINVYGGYIYSSSGAGIDIEGGSSINLQIGALATAQTSITTGSSIDGPVVIGPVRSAFTYNLNPTTASWVTLGQGPVPFSLNGSAVAGRFYGAPLTSTPVNMALDKINRLYAVPIFISHPSLLKTLSFDIGTANSALWHAEMCVFADNGRGSPGALVPSSDTGTIAIAPGTRGVQTAVLNSGLGVQLIGPGWYWLAFEADSAAESLYSISAANGLSGLYTTTTLGTNSAGDIFNGTGTSGVYTSQTFAACPPTFRSPALGAGIPTPYLVMGY
jgi:hypothetical protein